MKEQIYTIPIGEAYDEPDGCPICRLQEKLTQETLTYTLGAAMMEPDVRVTMNAQGFCSEHLRVLLGMGNRLSFALVLESRLDTLMHMTPEKLAASADTCYVCARSSGFMDKCLENILFLWETQPEFREKMQSRRHCLPHTAALLKLAPKAMRKKNYLLFAATFPKTTQQELEAIKGGVSRFCKSFDHRFAGQELGEDKQAVERAVAYLRGESV